MAHQRKLIRQAVVAKLTNATAAGARVQGTRVEPHEETELPAISVYTLSEQVDPDTDSAPRELERDVKLEIAAWVEHTDALSADDAMDDIAEQIERVMDLDRYLDGAAAESVLESTEMQIVEDDDASDPLVGIVILTYSVTYRTSPAPPGDLDDFLRVKAAHQIVGAVDDNAARDEFVVQETPP